MPPAITAAAARLAGLFAPKSRHRAWAWGAVFALLLLLRQPGRLVHASFWGEDGWTWYPDAYAHGASSLFWPHTGYLQTLSRLVALAVQPFPLAWAPTLFAACALIVQVLPAAFLVSARMDERWPSLPQRLLFALLAIHLPNATETFVNLTDAQWHLALLAFLVAVASPARSRAGALCDGLVLLVSGLSGPFCLFLLPIAAFPALFGLPPAPKWRAGFLAAAAAVQLWCLAHAAGRLPGTLGTGPVALARIIALQVVGGAELGLRTLRRIAGSDAWGMQVACIVVALAALALGLGALWRGPPLLRAFGCFAALILAAALATPIVSASVPAWQLMAHQAGAGNRYFLIPMLAWLGILFWLAGERRLWPRSTGIALLLLMALWGVPTDWHQPHQRRPEFLARARAMEEAPAGTRMEFPITPIGAPPMLLVKRGD